MNDVPKNRGLSLPQEPEPVDENDGHRRTAASSLVAGPIGADDGGEGELPVVHVRGKSISVPPSPVASSEGLEVIVDEPFADEDDWQGALDADEYNHLRDEVRRHYHAGEYHKVLTILQVLLARRPDDQEMRLLLNNSKAALGKAAEARIGDMTRAPAVLLSPAEITGRQLEPLSGFVLSHVDGQYTFEDIVDVSGLPRAETCLIIAALLDDGIIA